MISLDQVLVLEQKVESAVKKITQLQAENDALRRKCAELTNSLSSKSEQLTTFEQDQGLIESKILNLINQFNSIENTVMDVIGQSGSKPVQAVQQVVQPVAAAPQTQQVPVQAVTQAVSQPKSVENTSEKIQNVSFQPEINRQNSVHSENIQKEPVQPAAQSFFDMNEVQSENTSNEQPEDGQFDIF